MKKIFLSFIVFITIIWFSTTSFAYDLSAKDKVLVHNLTTKIEKVIEKKWEHVRESLIKQIEKLADKYKKQSRLEAILLQVIENINNNLEKEFDNILNTIDTKSELFSTSKINEITKKLESLEKINYDKNYVLSQWNFKAEYFPPKDYTKDTDKIVITIDNKKYELPWVYSESERKKYVEAIKKWWCRYWEDNSITEPSYIDCIASKEFGTFIWFSPSWYYILYNIWGYEYNASKLVDIKTWKVFLDIVWWVTMNTWTNDKAQFIYWQVGWIANDGGLYITMKWIFPTTKKINDSNILAWYVDDNYIYVKTQDNNGENQKIFIYDLKDLKLVYSK